jgi:protein phosphatase
MNKNIDDELHIHMGISSIIGTREYQQDSVFGDVSGDKTLAIVCDGMGGLNGGEIASSTAAKILINDFFELDSFNDIPGFFRNEAIKMDRKVNALTTEDGKPLDGGTTIVSVIIDKDSLYWLSVGDSRIYIIRDREILPVNRDHNYRLILDEKLNNGSITPEEYIAEEAQAEALISYIGMGNVSLMDINETPLTLMEDDIILLCSDGLYKRLSDDVIYEWIKFEEPDMERAAKRLTDVVLKKTIKSQDNTSLVLLQYSKYQ